MAGAALALVRNICKGRLLQVGAGVQRGAAARGRARLFAEHRVLTITLGSVPSVGGCSATPSVGVFSQALIRRARAHPPPCICRLQVLCTGAAVVAFYWPKPWTFPALIVIGGLVTLAVKRKDVIKVRLGPLLQTRYVLATWSRWLSGERM